MNERFRESAISWCDADPSPVSAEVVSSLSAPAAARTRLARLDGHSVAYPQSGHWGSTVFTGHSGTNCTHNACAFVTYTNTRLSIFKAGNNSGKRGNDSFSIKRTIYFAFLMQCAFVYSIKFTFAFANIHFSSANDFV